MAEDFYETLGVDGDASQDDIESAYRARVKETHPDVSDEEGAAEEFKRVVRAEEVLGDTDERERYDRLGHDEYVRRVDGYGDDADEGADDDPFDRWKDEWTEQTDDGPSGQSHHARQRARRRASWFTGDATVGDEAGGPGGPGSSGGPGGPGSQRRRRQRPGGAGPEDWDAHVGGGDATASGPGTAADSGAGADGGPAGFGGLGETATDRDSTYSVHDWEDEAVSDGPTRVTMTQEAMLLVCAMFVLYPIFLFSSLTPMFPLFVNVVVGLCTLVVMGYMLTMPRVAIAVFGSWSGLTALAMLATGWGPLSVTGLIALMATFVPLGYAVGVSRLLR